MDGWERQPTMRWVKRQWDEVQHNSDGDAVGVIRRQERVLQQCVETSEGGKWVDVPELDDNGFS